MAQYMLAWTGMFASVRTKLACWSRTAGQHPVWLISFGLAAVTLAIYGPVINFDFVEFDDPDYVTSNGAVQRGLSFEGVLWAFRGSHVGNYHPLAMLSHMLDCSLFGVAPGGHHLTSLLFHTTNVVLLFLLIRRMTGAVWRSAIVAGLFAWHPLHVESVAWIAERKDVLSTFFLLLTIWAYVRYAEKPGLGRYSLVVLWLALGLMSKPMLVTLPCILLLLDYWPLGRLRSRQHACDHDHVASRSVISLLLEKVPLFALSAAESLATMLAQTGDHTVISMHSVPMASRLGNTVMGYAGYLQKMLFPVNLCAYYPLTGVISPIPAVCSSLVLIGVSLLVWRLGKVRRYLTVGWLWYLVMLLPVIGFVQVSGQAMADRYTYVPLVGMFIMIVWSLTPWIEGWNARAPIKVALIGAVFLSCLLGTAAQLRYWRNGVWLFTRCLEVAPNNYLVRHNLGCALSARGHKAEAAAEFTESLRCYPNNAMAHYCLALDLTDLGQTSEALAHYSEAARLRPRDASTQLNWGVLLAQQGHVSEAIEHFVAAIKFEPDNPSARLNLANALNQQGRTADALVQYRTTLKLAPAWPQALNRLAFVLATHQEERFRDGAMAVRLAEAANKLTAETQPALMNTLAAAYAEAGHFDKAVAAGQRARQLALNSSQNALIPQIENCLQFYKAGKPYHEEQQPNADQKMKIQD